MATAPIAELVTDVLPRILVADPLPADGLEHLGRAAAVEVRTKLNEDELASAVADADALIVRSETKVTARVLAAGRRLRVVGRAGVGVDNIDVEAATRQGVLVVNAPHGNVVAVAEHTFALMLGLARSIPQAAASLKRGEWERSRFLGRELRGKTLGVVGLGNIGSEVARRGLGFEMQVVAYDPVVPHQRASDLGVELVELAHLLTTADFVTIHVPLLPATRNLISDRELAAMKPGAFLVNAARGGIVNEHALLEALRSRRLAGAAADVYEREPAIGNELLELDNFVGTPHLAASTHEAQSSVARDVADQVIGALRGDPVSGAVNAPSLPSEALAAVRPYELLAERLAALHVQLHGGRPAEVSIAYGGELAQLDTSLVAAAAIRGLLTPFVQERINYVNARAVAAARGIRLTETRSPAHHGREADLTLTVGGRTISGAASDDGPTVTALDSFSLSFPARGRLLVTRHHDRPGIVGEIGTLLGSEDVNIAAMGLGRDAPRGAAVMVLAVDDAVGAPTLDKLRQVRGIQEITYAELGLGDSLGAGLEGSIDGGAALC